MKEVQLNAEKQHTRKKKPYNPVFCAFVPSLDDKAPRHSSVLEFDLQASPRMETIWDDSSMEGNQSSSFWRTRSIRSWDWLVSADGGYCFWI